MAPVGCRKPVVGSVRAASAGVATKRAVAIRPIPLGSRRRIRAAAHQLA
jgi:hypothetical protein